VKDFNEKNILNYISLVGEIVLKKYHGWWQMDIGKDNITCNPYLVIIYNKIDILSYTYEDMVQSNNGLTHLKESITDIIDYRRRKGRK
jgi:hypothetical protein